MSTKLSGGDGGDHSHVIDIDVGDHGHATASAAESDGEGSRRCCAVCMDGPMEWVAVGACGHREVCGGCAVLYRFSRCDHRCSICRMPCPTVLVTRAGRDEDCDGDGRLRDAFSRPPACEGRVGEQSYWYHAGAAAYFDDEQQYEAAKATCKKQLPAAGPLCRLAGEEGLAQPPWPVHPPPRRREDDDDGHDRELSIVKALVYALYIGFTVASFAAVTWNCFH